MLELQCIPSVRFREKSRVKSGKKWFQYGHPYSKHRFATVGYGPGLGRYGLKTEIRICAAHGHDINTEWEGSKGFVSQCATTC